MANSPAEVLLSGLFHVGGGGGGEALYGPQPAGVIPVGGGGSIPICAGYGELPPLEGALC